MSDSEKLAMVKAMMGSSGVEDELIAVYLSLAETEILNYLYSLVGGVPEDVTEVPPQYDVTQVMAVLAGYGISGAEGQGVHNENGISRTFVYPDMMHYIRSNVIAFARVV